MTPLARRRRRILFMQDLCLVALRLSGWLAVTGLATLGCFVLAFLAIGGLSVEQALLHLDNMAGRFAEADAARRAAFAGQLTMAAGIVFAVIALCRRRAITALFLIDKEPGHA